MTYNRKSTNVHKIVVSCALQYGSHPLRTLSQKLKWTLWMILSERYQTPGKRHLECTNHVFISRWPHLVIGATALNGPDSLVAQRKWVMTLQKSFTTATGGNPKKREGRGHKHLPLLLWESASPGFLVCYLIFNLWSQQKALS